MGATAAYRIDDPEGRARWDALKEHASIVSPFGCYRVAEVAARSIGAAASFLFAYDTDNDLAGAIRFHRRIGPFHRAVHPAICYYSPLLLATEPADADVHTGSDDLSLLLDSEWMRRPGVRLHLPPTLHDVRPAQVRHFDVHPFYTYLLDPTNATPDSWSTSTRRLFRRYRNRYSFVVDPGITREVIALTAQSYLRSGRKPPFDPAALAAALEYLIDRETVIPVAVLDDGGTVSGGALILMNRETAAYWIAGSQPGPAMTVLIGRLLDFLRQREIRLFDFLGANTLSIAEFKRRFGATLHPFYHVSRPGSLLLSLANRLRPR